MVVHNLKEKIHSVLDTIITKDYVLLDIPDHNNIGDNLIWEGQLSYLKRLKVNCLGEYAYWAISKESLSKADLILFTGGGNFGDLYPVINELRINIIREYTDKTIVIFPQSIHYTIANNFNKDLDVLKMHPDLHICVRDEESYNLLIEGGIKNVYLIPDMAFCIDFEKYHIKNQKTGRTLYMRRKDKEIDESKDSMVHRLFPHVEVKDWPTFNISKNRQRIEYRKERYNKIVSKKLLKIPLLNRMVDTRYGLKSRHQRENYIQQGITFFESYDHIITTRLHGLILAVLMNKNVSVVDNNNKKLTRFYNMWLKDFPNVKLLIF